MKQIKISDSYVLLEDAFIKTSGGDLFNSLEFFHLHTSEGINAHYFQLQDSKSQLILGSIHFSEIEPRHFRSPYRGSYGGFELDAKVPLEAREEFISGVEHQLKTSGAKRLTIVTCPFAYDESLSAQNFNLLFRKGFQIENHELNYSMAVDTIPFEEKIDYGNLKRLKKCRRENLEVRQLSASEVKQAYEVISENRTRRGFPITMSWDALNEMMNAISNSIVCFGVFQQEKMVASAICIPVNPKILYVFYWGEVSGMESLSPVTLLAERIYRYCLENKIELLDIGTSTVKGIPNYGLIRFKKNLGCTESLKLTYTKELS